MQITSSTSKREGLGSKDRQPSCLRIPKTAFPKHLELPGCLRPRDHAVPRHVRRLALIARAENRRRNRQRRTQAPDLMVSVISLASHYDARFKQGSESGTISFQ